MERTDFVNCAIKDFTLEEIVSSGAKLEDVQVETIMRLQRLRTKIMAPIHILKNGLTSGKHQAREHREGKAVDVYIKRFSSISVVVYSAIECGFCGIGVYYNHEAGTHTFHFDLGPVRFWSANKNKTKAAWSYNKLLKDPKEIV